MNIILCGLPGSGKSEVGQLLAMQLGLMFLDTDRIIEMYYDFSTSRSLTCLEILQKVGEKEFRRLENAAISAMEESKKSVIAVGEGAFLDPENVKILKKLGKIIYLRANSKKLLQRALRNGVPPYLDKQHPEESFQKLVDARSPKYEELSSLVVDTDGMLPNDVVASIMSRIKEYL